MTGNLWLQGPGPSVLLKAPPKGKNADTPPGEEEEEGDDYDTKIVSYLPFLPLSYLAFLTLDTFAFHKSISFVYV